MTTATYRHTFKRAFSDKEKSLLLDHIKSSILNKVKTDVYLSWDDLHFAVPFWISKSNLFAMVDKGNFRFGSDNTLIYEISYSKTFIIGLILALTLAFALGQIVIVSCVFAIQFFLSWVIRKLRHDAFFNNIVFYADSLIDNIDNSTRKTIHDRS